MTLANELQASLAHGIYSADRDRKRLWSKRQSALEELYRDVTGRSLPEIVPFTTEDGTRWCIRVHITLDKVGGPSEG